MNSPDAEVPTAERAGVGRRRLIVGAVCLAVVACALDAAEPDWNPCAAGAAYAGVCAGDILVGVWGTVESESGETGRGVVLYRYLADLSDPANIRVVFGGR